MKYTNQNDTGQLLVIFLHQFEMYVQYLTNITSMVGFISLIFLVGFSFFNFFSTKLQNNIVELLFFIPGVIDEPQDNSRFKLIVVSEIGLLLEFDRYSCDLVLSSTVPIPYLDDN